MRRLLLRPEAFIYLAFFAFTFAFFVLQSFVQSGEQDILKHYANLNGPRMVWTMILLFVALLIHGTVLWVKALITHADPAAVFTRRNVTRAFLGFLRFLRNFGVVGIPFLLAFSSLSLALGPLNVFNSTRLRDELLFGWDTFLTGTFPPLALASFQYPSWFVAAVEFSFFHLVPVLTIFGAYLFLAHQRLFREAAGAFFLSALLMFVGWTLFPVISPYYRFVTNEYNLSVPSAAQHYVDGYAPQKEIQDFWVQIDASLGDLSVLPTTAFPSAHVVWAMFLVYYSYRVWKWLLLFSLPFALLSTFGTNLFAAHYFVDIPAGLLCAAAAIFIVRLVAQKDKIAQ